MYTTMNNKLRTPFHHFTWNSTFNEQATQEKLRINIAKQMKMNSHQIYWCITLCPPCQSNNKSGHIKKHLLHFMLHHKQITAIMPSIFIFLGYRVGSNRGTCVPLLGKSLVNDPFYCRGLAAHLLPSCAKIPKNHDENPNEMMRYTKALSMHKIRIQTGSAVLNYCFLNTLQT